MQYIQWNLCERVYVHMNDMNVKRKEMLMKYYQLDMIRGKSENQKSLSTNRIFFFLNVKSTLIEESQEAVNISNKIIMDDEYVNKKHNKEYKRRNIKRKKKRRPVYC